MNKNLSMTQSVTQDSDTITAITVSVAKAFYGVPDKIKEHTKTYIPDELLNIILEIEQFLNI